MNNPISSLDCNLIGLLFCLWVVAVGGAGWSYQGCFAESYDGVHVLLVEPYDIPYPTTYERCWQLARDRHCITVGISLNGRCRICDPGVSNGFSYSELNTMPNCPRGNFHIFRYKDSLSNTDCYPASPVPCGQRGNAATEELQSLVKRTEECRSVIDIRKGFLDSCYGFKFDRTNRLMQCTRLFLKTVRDAKMVESDNVKVSYEVPPVEMQHDYSLGGAIPFYLLTVNDYVTDVQNVWNLNLLTGYECLNNLSSDLCLFMESLPQRVPISIVDAYNRLAGRTAFSTDSFAEVVNGGVGLVFADSQSAPWIENLMLRAGAAHIISVRSQPTVTQSAEITIVSHVQLASQYLAGFMKPLDFAIALNEFQHHGFGRREDILDANGDLKAMAEMHCLLKPGGYLLLSVPLGSDLLVFNSHRVYGRQRLPRLLSGWDIVDVIGTIDLNNPIFLDSYPSNIIVLRKL
jgi:hypothetical protein